MTQTTALRHVQAREWRIWQSVGSDGGPGAWYAVRPLTAAEHRMGLHATVVADTVRELQQRLAEQAARDAQLLATWSRGGTR